MYKTVSNDTQIMTISISKDVSCSKQLHYLKFPTEAELPTSKESNLPFSQISFPPFLLLKGLNLFSFPLEQWEVKFHLIILMMNTQLKRDIKISMLSK